MHLFDVTEHVGMPAIHMVCVCEYASLTNVNPYTDSYTYTPISPVVNYLRTCEINF